MSCGMERDMFRQSDFLRPRFYQVVQILSFRQPCKNIVSVGGIHCCLKKTIENVHLRRSLNSFLGIAVSLKESFPWSALIVEAFQ